MELRENALNNLGESLRHVEQADEAARVLKLAERVATRRGDQEAAISIAHNRALALESMKQHNAARRVLIRCRDRSRKGRIWHEFIRSLEGLANLESSNSRPAHALRFYKEAFRQAQKHQQRESLPRLVLNYSRFLQWHGKTAKALVQFKTIERDIPLQVDAQVYYLTQGSLYFDVGQYGRAIGAYERGLEHAAKVDDRNGAVDLAEHLAEAREK